MAAGDNKHAGAGREGEGERPQSATPALALSTLSLSPHPPHALSPFPSPQGLLTNDVTRLAGAGAAAPLYAALLTPAGRVVADVHLSRAGGGAAGASTSSPSSASSASSPPPPPPPALLADVDAAAAPALLRALAMYRLRADVDVADASDEWGVWWWGGGGGGGGSGGAAPPPSPLSPFFRPDPRGVAGLGWRALIPHTVAEAAAAAGAGGGDASPSSSPSPPAAADAPLRAARFRLGVAEGAELAGLIPLEAGLDGLRGIAFDKGCYVGQELVARTHFRGEVRKRVVGFVVGEGGDGRLPAPGAALALAGGGEAGAAPAVAAAAAAGTRPARPPGTVLAVDEASGTGLALVRTAAALPAGVLRVEGGGGSVRLVRPAWWPAGLGEEG